VLRFAKLGGKDRMGAEVLYLVGGAVVLLLAVLSDHPRFRGKTRSEASGDRLKTEQTVPAVRVGETHEVASTPAAAAVRAQPFQTAVPGIQRRPAPPS